MALVGLVHLQADDGFQPLLKVEATEESIRRQLAKNPYLASPVAFHLVPMESVIEYFTPPIRGTTTPSLVCCLAPLAKIL